MLVKRREVPLDALKSILKDSHVPFLLSNGSSETVRSRSVRTKENKNEWIWIYNMMFILTTGPFSGCHGKMDEVELANDCRDDICNVLASKMPKKAKEEEVQKVLCNTLGKVADDCLDQRGKVNKAWRKKAKCRKLNGILGIVCLTCLLLLLLLLFLFLLL